MKLVAQKFFNGIVWGATFVRMAVACAHARPMVARLWKKYAPRWKVNTFIVSGLFLFLIADGLYWKPAKRSYRGRGKSDHPKIQT